MKINNPKLLWQLTFEGNWPSAVAFLGSGQKLAAANQEGMLYIWDLPTEVPKFDPPKNNSERKAPDHAPVRRLDGHTNGITQLRATRDGKLLVSASLDHSIRFWKTDDAATGKADAVLDMDQRRSKFKREKKEEILKAPGVEVETQSAAKVLEGHRDWILALDMSADEKRLISGDAKAGVITWELPEGKEISRWTGLPWNWIHAAALSADGKLAAVSEQCDKRDDFDVPAPALRLYDTEKGEVTLDVLKKHLPKYNSNENSYGSSQVWRKFVSSGLVAVDISPDGKLLAAGQGGENDTGKIHIIEIETGKVLREVSGHRYGVTDVKFSANGELVLSTGRDTTLRITQVNDGKEVAALGSPRGGQFKDWFAALAISPDEKFVATADIAGLVQVFALDNA
jgi:WD40 repeat protein